MSLATGFRKYRRALVRTARGRLLLGGPRLVPLLLMLLVLLVACSVSPAPPATPTAPAPATRAVPTLATPVPPTSVPLPTPRPTATLQPAPTVGQVAFLSTVVTTGALTVVPALQATGVAMLPTVASAVNDLVASQQTQELVRQVGALLGGISLAAEQTPPGALPADTTRLVLRGSDTAGSLARFQPLARQIAAQAALVAASQLFANASIELTVVDGSGTMLLHGTRQPGYQPEVSVAP